MINDQKTEQISEAVFSTIDYRQGEPLIPKRREMYEMKSVIAVTFYLETHSKSRYGEEDLKQNTVVLLDDDIEF